MTFLREKDFKDPKRRGARGESNLKGGRGGENHTPKRKTWDQNIYGGKGQPRGSPNWSKKKKTGGLVNRQQRDNCVEPRLK